jgi:hypothetical protein
MTTVFRRGSIPERPPTDGEKLLSLALDAQLVGYEDVAQILTLLAEALNRGNRRDIARIILTRAQMPGVGFDTLLDNLDLSGLASRR